VRFGQFTVFLPLLLKPAPTRLRLVLWSLANGLQEFPESPPPGLVTIPNLPEVPRTHYTLAGYHPAGARAIRIDMLERLADLLRAKDSRAGFEATPEMLSITGMTLEQFAGLMGGLGYRGDKGERPKQRPETARAEPEAAGVEAAADSAAGTDAPEAAPPAEAAVPEPATAEDAAPPGEAAEPAAAAPVEMETFYTFVWAPRPRGGEARGNRNRPERPAERGPRPDRNRQDRAPAAPAPEGTEAAAVAEQARPPRGDRGERPAGGDGRRKDGPPRSGQKDRGSEGGFKGKPKGKGGDRPQDRPERGERSGDRPAPQSQPKTFESRPPRAEKIDPDNPFAVLAALRLKS
jgi:ATP-dependent RNA helicase SUPV3L1/SUV3